MAYQIVREDEGWLRRYDTLQAMCSPLHSPTSRCHFSTASGCLSPLIYSRPLITLNCTVSTQCKQFLPIMHETSRVTRAPAEWKGSLEYILLLDKPVFTRSSANVELRRTAAERLSPSPSDTAHGAPHRGNPPEGSVWLQNRPLVFQ